MQLIVSVTRGATSFVYGAEQFAVRPWSEATVSTVWR